MGRVYGASCDRESIDLRIARLAAAQHGVFTRRQAVAHGATKGTIQHRLRSDRWEAIARDVFRLNGTARTWHQEMLVECLLWGDDAVLSHRAAGPHWGFAGSAPGRAELIVRANRQRRGSAIIHRIDLDPRDRTVLDAIPVTTPARTLFDLAAVAPYDRVEEALDDAIRRRIVSIPRLRRRLDSIASQGRPGIRAMRALLEDRDPSIAVSESDFERRLLRQLRRRRLPAPTPQYPIHDDRGLVGRADFAWPDARLVIEADSFRWHSARSRFEHDRIRRNRLTLLGWRIIHVTWAQLKSNPDAVVDGIELALTS